MAKKQNSISDRLALTNLETLLKIPLIKRKGLIGIDALMSKRAAKFKPSKGFKFYQKEFDGVKTDIIERIDSEHKKAILYFHSGAFVSGTTDTHRSVGELFLQYSNADTVIVVNYRTAPEYEYPAAHEDAFTVLKNISDSYGTIITAGDSSGGNLALSTALMARDRGERIPDGIILISPWADFTRSGKTYKTNYDKDPMFGYLSTPKDHDLVELYSKNADKTDKYLSPVFSSFSSLPPMLIEACENELLLEDAYMIKECADKSGINTKLLIYKGMFHSFQTISLNAATSKTAWNDMGKYINNISKERENAK